MKKRPEDSSEYEDLEKSAPLLFSIKKSMSMDAGFITPDGYFESLNSEVVNKTEALPDFETASNANPFKTPEGYFDALPTIIQHRIISQNKKRVPVYTWIQEVFSSPVPKYSLALVSLLLVVFFSIKYFTRTIKVEYANDGPETEQLESFYLSQLDETVLSEAYAEERVTTTNLPDNGIENYLLENNIDLNLISEQL
jgi:hypothetical protein